jgi:uncharacterized protein YbgA (DUF1722 family)/uncharacterized protein YbbK (DUF523 family)
MTDHLKLGISACLLGQNVRYNGGHTRDHFLTDTLGQYLNYVPICPEVECGMPIPWEALRLVGDPENPRIVTSKTGRDMTAQMKIWAEKRLDQLEAENLCGFIFKSASPSSGAFNVKVYTQQGMPSKRGTGIFAKMFMDRFPLLPVEEEGRLHDPVLREDFIERIFVYKRWLDLLNQRKSRGGLVDFHARHKLLIMAHSPMHYREIGKFVADAKSHDLNVLFDTYAKSLHEALCLRATTRKHLNVLMHIMGYFKKQLSTDEKQELLEILGQFRENFLPLIVPVTLLNHYVRKYDQPYLKSQVYLNPHPSELGLRNHA